MKELEKVTDSDIDSLFSHYNDKLEDIELFLSHIKITDEEIKAAFAEEEIKTAFAEELQRLYCLQKDVKIKKRKINAPALKFTRMVDTKARKINYKVLCIEELILDKIKKYEDKK